MAKRRGFFAELQHQSAIAERDRQRAQATAVREVEKQRREAEGARRAAERAHQLAVRADSHARTAAENEARRLHVEAQEAEVEALNAGLASNLDDIDSVLAWTLGVDDHVELEKLRRVATFPPFTSAHQSPVALPAPISAPPEPAYVDPPAPTGVGAMFGRKKHVQAVERARAEYSMQHSAWRAEAAGVPLRQFEAANRYQAAETARRTGLHADQASYHSACQQRQARSTKRTQNLTPLSLACRLAANLRWKSTSALCSETRSTPM